MKKFSQPQLYLLDLVADGICALMVEMFCAKKTLLSLERAGAIVLRPRGRCGCEARGRSHGRWDRTRYGDAILEENGYGES